MIKTNFVYTILLNSFPFKFPDKCIGFSLEFVDEFTKIVPRSFGPFIGHHQGLLARIKNVFKEFRKFLGFL